MNDVERKNSISESLSYYYDIENVEDTSVHSNDEFFDAICKRKKLFYLVNLS